MDEKTVEAVASILRAHFSVPGVWTYKFEVYEPGFHHDGWVIADEEGPDDWPFEAREIVTLADDAPDVYIEAINHWSIVVLDIT